MPHKQRSPADLPMAAATGSTDDLEITPADSAGVFFSSQAADVGGPALADDASLAALFSAAGLWRGSELGAPHSSVYATGYPALDACLPGSGWPVAGLTELLSDHNGVGELRLLMPGLAALAASKPGWIVWIAPPYLPNAPALLQWGLTPERILLIHPRSAADAAWAAEQALASGTCIAVLLWTTMLESGALFLPGTRRRGLSMQQFSRRLQLAGASHDCWAIALRDAAARRQPSAAMLRLYIEAMPSRRDLHVLKVRGGTPTVIEDFDRGIDVHGTMVAGARAGDSDTRR